VTNLKPESPQTTPTSPLVRSILLKTAAGSFSLKITAAGLGFINSILMARLLTPREFGIYAIIMAAAGLALLVLCQWTPEPDILDRLAIAQLCFLVTCYHDS